ncbi:MAG TPA: Rad52/Rad22 family DNA repair protein [Terracidiphilus sp.]|nr:Rad52/Rad22 family DNA repair protein [Terracidiphilus sp.]
MATEETKASPDPNNLFVELAEPFDPSEIKWRVTHTSRDGNRGAVIAFADPRAYTDRLNQLFTPTGWTRTYDVSTVSSVTRMKKDKLIQTGKVLVTCILTITGLGCHSGSGEEWADEENAMTSAEAQAFKRAASCFGLGRYLYNFTEVWVSLNEYRQPTQFPQLPQWALPKSHRLGKAHLASGPRPPTIQRGSIDQKVTAKVEGFRRILGDAIYGEILCRAGHVRRANDIPNAQLQANVAEAMERAVRGIRKANSLAEQIGEASFVAVMDRLQIESMATIPKLESLKALVIELEEAARSVA